MNDQPHWIMRVLWTAEQWSDEIVLGGAAVLWLCVVLLLVM